jgi:predicted PurR-regulated permease PerM
MNKDKLLLRIISFPVILVMLVCVYIYVLVWHSYNFVRWGGEWITYRQNEKKNIQDIYNLLKEKQNGERFQVDATARVDQFNEPLSEEDMKEIMQYVSELRAFRLKTDKND